MQLVRGGSPRAEGNTGRPLTCIAAHRPPIGRAGHPHQPRCSPHWHLSGEGAVSQNLTPEPSVSQTAAHPPAPTPMHIRSLKAEDSLGNCLCGHCWREIWGMFPVLIFFSCLLEPLLQVLATPASTRSHGRRCREIRKRQQLLSSIWQN